MSLESYLEAKVLTAPPHQLHLLVVEGAIRAARQAEAALAAGNHGAARRALGNSREFMTELLAGLNRDHAPDLVDQLQALFVFVYRRLADAELRLDAQAVQQALRILDIHRQTWLQLTEQLRRQPAHTPPTPHALRTTEGAPARSWEA